MPVDQRKSYRRQVFQFIVVFAILAAASSALETWMRARHVGLGYQAAIARTVRALSRPLGVEARTGTGDDRCSLGIGAIQLVVTTECAAILATGLFVAAALAFPCSWRARLVGVVVGVVGVGLLNLIRIVVLAVVAQHKPAAFDLAHDVLMQGFLVIMVTPLWLGWLAWVVRRAKPAVPTSGTAGEES